MTPPGVVRRAPRLAPHERIAPHVTRVGRFAGVDPSVTSPPSPAALAGIAAWTAWCASVVGRAWLTRHRG